MRTIVVKTILRLITMVIIAAILGCKQSTSVQFFNSLTTAPPISPSPSLPVTPLECDSTITTNYGGGTGTTLDPYTICTLAQWKFLGTDTVSWNKAFKLYADIDFTGETAATFTPIGTVATPFTGRLNGNNFKLMNLTLAPTNQTWAFFKYTNSNVTIENLTLKNISFTGTARMSGLVLEHGNGGTLTFDHIALDNVQITMNGSYDNCSLFVGNTAGAVVASNITLANTSLTANISSSNYWGTIVGRTTATVAISSVTGSTVSVGGTSAYSIGGLIGNSQSSANFTDITITGLNVHSTTSGGGLANVIWNSTTVSNVHLSGTIFGVTQAAGLIAEMWGMGSPTLTLSNSSFDGAIDASSAGGLIGLASGNISINRSYFKGTLGSVWNGTGGGLIYQHSSAASTATISDSYVVANLTIVHAANYLISGLVGRTAGTLVINRSYYAGTLTGAAPKACIGTTVGSVSYTTNDVYYDSTLCTVNASVSGAIAGTTALATAALQTATPFSNWLPSVWVFTNGQNPKLIWEP